MTFAYLLDFAAGLPSLQSSHVAVLDNLTKNKAPDSLKPLEVTAYTSF